MVFIIEQIESYAVYQVIQTDDTKSFYVALDYCRSDLPEICDLEQTQPLRNQMWKNHGSVFCGWIGSRYVPNNYIFLGNMKIGIHKVSDIYTGEEWPQGEQYLAVKNWMKLPEECRQLYKRHINSHEQVLVGGSHGKYFPKRQERITKELLEAVGNLEELNEFPCLNELEITDITDSLCCYLSSRPMIRTGIFTEVTQKVLDLSQTYLIDLSICASGLQKLILNDSVNSLRLSGKIGADFQVSMKNRGAQLYLEYQKPFEELPHFGLTNLENLKIKFYQIDILQLSEAFPKLKSLYLLGEPGTAMHMEAAGEWVNLEKLILEDVFGFGETEMHTLLKLEKLSVINAESIPEEAGMYLKKEFKKRMDFFSVKKLRRELWLQENRNNPFRHWDNSEFVPQDAYKKVLAAYRKLVKVWISGSRDEILQGVMEYGKTLNGLNRKYDYFIETTEREDIFQALKELATENENREKDIVYMEAEKLLENIKEEW